jgi:nicotinamidase-related amidase
LSEGQLRLPVRFYNGPADVTIDLDPAATALMIVDCDGEFDRRRGAVIEEHIAPALAAARRIGMKVFYFYEASYGIGGPRDIYHHLHAAAGQGVLAPSGWKPAPRPYTPSIAPRPEEPEIPKDNRDGFTGVHADRFLKTWGIDTLIAAGFALASCLYHTCLGAKDRNYRVVLLRDCTCPPGVSEFPDTLDAGNPEGGWMRFAFLRLFEAKVGFTSTSREFIRACADATR